MILISFTLKAKKNNQLQDSWADFSGASNVVIPKNCHHNHVSPKERMGFPTSVDCKLGLKSFSKS